MIALHQHLAEADPAALRILCDRLLEAEKHGAACTGIAQHLRHFRDDGDGLTLALMLSTQLRVEPDKEPARLGRPDRLAAAASIVICWATGRTEVYPAADYTEMAKQALF